jgi:hypothetical protein
MRGEQLAASSPDQNCFSRKIWRSIATLVFLMFLAGWAPLRASTPQFQKAVVLHVERFQPTLPYRRRIADSPPPPAEYDFEVSLRMGCLVYVGLYQSAIDYLPSGIAPDQPVDVSLEKHVMRVKSPGGKEIVFENTRHYRTATASCSAGH